MIYDESRNIFCPPPHPQIIDSIMALFRVDFSGRGELAERQQKLAQMLSRLQKISEGQYKYAVDVRNGVRCEDGTRKRQHCMNCINVGNCFI